MTNYQTGVLENSAKMVLLFHLIDESVRRGDKILVFRWEMFAVFMCDSIQMFAFFSNLSLGILNCQSCCYFTSTLTLASLSVCDSCSQSLSTLTIMEDFLSQRPLPIQTETGMHNWVRNVNYYSEFSNVCWSQGPGLLLLTKTETIKKFITWNKINVNSFLFSWTWSTKKLINKNQFKKIKKEGIEITKIHSFPESFPPAKDLLPKI